jgi:hypothetical protein
MHDELSCHVVTDARAPACDAKSVTVGSKCFFEYNMGMHRTSGHSIFKRYHRIYNHINIYTKQRLCGRARELNHSKHIPV